MADFPAAITIQVKSREALQKIVEIEKKLADVVRDYEIGITKVSKSYEKIVAQTKLIASSQKEVNRELLRAAKIQQTIQNARSARIAREGSQRIAKENNLSGGLGPGLPPGRIFGPAQDFAGQAAAAAQRTAVADARAIVRARINENRALRAQGGLQENLIRLGKTQQKIYREINRDAQKRLTFERQKEVLDRRARNNAKNLLKLQILIRDVNQDITKEKNKQVAAGQKQTNNRVQNAALGVGFPLLFGGGPGAVLGGGLGALAGGFGGSVIASGIGAQLDQFAQKAAELGQALNDPINNIEAITDSLGVTGTETQKYIEYLEESERAAEAASVATAELAALVGQDGVDALKEFGSDTQDLANEFTIAMTQMQAALAGFINESGILKTLLDQISFGNALRQAEGLRGSDTKLDSLLDKRDQANKGTLFGGDPPKS